MDEYGFLEKLKKKYLYTSSSVSTKTKQEDLLFVVEYDYLTKEAFLRTVDKKGRDIDTDYRMYQEPLFSILRTIEQIRMQDQMVIDWGQKKGRVSLSSNPHLLYQLLDCNNLVTPELVPITPEKDNVYAIRLVLSKMVDKSSGAEQYLSFATAQSKEESIGGVVMLSDSFAYSNNKIFRTKSIGDGYQNLDYFCTTIPAELLDKYLSILYTNLSNFILDIDSIRVVENPDPVRARSTILIEKVDEDMALYLRVVQELPGIDPKFFEDFGLTRYASRTSADEITIRSIIQNNMDLICSDVLKRITRYSPSRTAAKAVYQDGNTFIIPVETAREFLFLGLPSLAQDFRILGAEKLAGYKIHHSMPKLNLSLSSGIDFLEGSATLSIKNETFTLMDFLQRYNKDHYIQLADGDKAIIDENYIRKLERLFHKGTKKGTSKISFFDLPEIAQMLDSPNQSEPFVRSRSFLEGINGLKDAAFKPAKGLKASLRAYQTEGIKWMTYLYDNKRGGCLADDMGLGKTVQTIAVLCHAYSRKKTDPSLIVMPKSLLFNWSSELAKFAPSLDVYTYYGNQRDIDEIKNHQIILTTYGMVRSDIEKLCEMEFDTIVLDESQNIRNTSAQMTQAVYLLKCTHRFALSGTPVENNITELYSLFRFLNPAMFSSLQDFNTKYTLPIQNGNDKDALEELRRKVYPYILRRTKGEVLDDLPDRVDQQIRIDLESEHASFYEQKRSYFYNQVHEGIAKNGIGKSQFLILQALTELRRIASVPESMSEGMIPSSKIPILMESLLEATSNGHKVVVFFNFIAGIELVAERLEREGIGFLTMTGSTSDRKSVVERFQGDSSVQVLLMTLKTGGVGLNLTAADTVFIFDPWWNRAEEEQAIGRLHRIGQKSKVMTFSFIAEGTIEEKMFLLQQKKKDIIDGLINADGSFGKSLTEEDIDYILC
ncbi:MAG: SNF2-related protein [Bacteroidales bacterium]|nr:SNF2-related protein [Bacteroidales bacterium]